MSVEELLDDWHSLDLAEEAVAVVAPDGTIAAYADVINRSFVTVSVYGYVHPDFPRPGIGHLPDLLGRALDARAHAPRSRGRARRRPALHQQANETAQRLLESLGYAPVRGVYVMETELHEAPAPTSTGPKASPCAPSSPARTSGRSSRPSRTPSGTCGEGRAARSSASSR